MSYAFARGLAEVALAVAFTPQPVGGRALVRFAQIAEKTRACRSNPRPLAESRPWRLKRLDHG